MSVRIHDTFTPHVQEILDRRNKVFRNFLNDVGREVVRVTREKWLSDPGRRFRVTRSGRKYPVYPRPRIGRVTGRLYNSFGNPSSEGIWRLSGTELLIGTRVPYARFVVKRKYNFAKRGLGDVFHSSFFCERCRKFLEELLK